MQRFDLTAQDFQSVLDPTPPPAVQGPSAAVAMIFRAGEQGTELFFIQRAAKATDPWSGHMAFPGGRTDATDRDSHHTAERETQEEVALDLTPAQSLGSLHDLRTGGRGSLTAVHGHAYWMPGERPVTTANYEVADMLWIPLSTFVDTERYIDYYYAGNDSTWPGIQLDNPDQVVWGLTLRFLADLFGRLDRPFIKLAPFPQGPVNAD